MADITDVMDALVAVIAQTLYPNGTGEQSIVGTPCSVFSGWPIPQQLDVDLAAGKVNISVWALPSERVTTRIDTDWRTLEVNDPTITATVNAQQITLSGMIATPQNVGAIVNGKAYVYPVQGNDSLTTIATGLASLINADVPGTASVGPVVTVPNNYPVKAARVGRNGQTIREVRRQERVFQISVWANSPEQRKAFVDAIDPVLSMTPRITLADEYMAHLSYRNSNYVDKNEKMRAYRADLMYAVEYATTQTENNTVIITVQENYASKIDGATQDSGAVTIYN